MTRKNLTPLAFGKYRGMTPSDVSVIDPSYIVWLHDVVGKDTVTEGLYEDARADVDQNDEDLGINEWDFVNND